MSENHRVEVVRINLRKHPNADSLSIVDVGGYEVVVRTDSWIGKEFGVFIPPDSIVPATEEYAFLATDGTLSSLEQNRRYRIIRAKRLRGVVSYGLLMPVPNSVSDPFVGMDLAKTMRIEHYDPTPVEEEREIQEKSIKSDRKFGKIFPKITNYPKHLLAHKTYELPNYKKICNSLPKFDYVSGAEKLHGSFTCYTYSQPTRKYAKGIWGKIQRLVFGIKDDLLGQLPYQIMMKSKNVWKTFSKPIRIEALNKEIMPKKHNWELALEHNPELISLIKLFPDHLIYGEIFGPIQKHYTYGHLVNNKPGPKYNKIQFRIFEIITPKGERIDGPNLYELLENHGYEHLMVPIVVWRSEKMLTPEELEGLSNDPSLIEDSDHRTEGIVLSFYNQKNELILKTKLVGSKYLLGEYQLGN